MSLNTSYKSPAHKLLKWFKESHDSWKTKYHELKKNFKQLENRIRFLESSKNRWKKEAIELRSALKKKQIDTKPPEITIPGGDSNTKKEESTCLMISNNDTVAGHTYSVEVILLLLQLILSASISLRGSERVLTVVNDSIGQPLISIPSWFSVRFWLLRIGS